MDAGDFEAIVSAVREFVEREVIPREDDVIARQMLIAAKARMAA